jgi:DNA-binding winged helix-turn-helix (wHTH) protein/DNA-binding beta-propeller fold protein YncE
VLRQDGNARPITPKALQLLLALVGNGGRILTKEELLNTVWAGTTVDQSNLPTQIALLRRVIGDGFVETIPTRGYRFAAEVTERWEEDAAPAMEAGPVPADINSSLEAPDSETVPAASGRTTRRGHVRVVVAVAGIVGIAFLGLIFLYRDHRAEEAIPSAKTGRLFAGVNSEGGSSRIVKLDRVPGSLLFTPDGKKLYSIENDLKTITVLDGSSFRVMSTISLPSAPFSAKMTRDGKRIYLGSKRDGLMVVDTEHDQVLSQVLPTGGPVYGLAVTPDEKKIFLAMASAGLKVMDVRTGKTKLLSGIACPVSLGIDPGGHELYVSYQCGGPGGRIGHDALEIYDVNSEQILATVSGPPMVGGDPSFSPNGQWVLLPGREACLDPQYDHIECPAVPSSVYHLLRSADRKIVKTFAMPDSETAGVFVPDGRRVLLSGDSLSVLDPLSGTVLEKLARPGEEYSNVAFTPAGNRAIVPVIPTGILVLDMLDERCLPSTQGLSNLYSGDGTLSDVRQVNSLEAEGGVDFAPGLIGQAFHFNGKDGLLHVRAWGACGGCGPSWSESLYVKFSELQGEMGILERQRLENDPEIRLRKTAEHRIVLEVADGSKAGPSVSTSEPISAGKWHHLAVVTDRGQQILYVDGSMIGRIQTPLLSPRPVGAVMGGTFIGAAHDRTRFLNGLVDEVAFYNRALSAAEIKGMYELSVHHPCVLDRAK